MRRLTNALMAVMAFAIIFWPSVCFGDELPDSDDFETIDTQEYLAAQQDTSRYNLFPRKLTGNSATKVEFISKVVEIDDEAKRCTLDPTNPDVLDPDALEDYNLYEIISGDAIIYMLDFEIWGVRKFCYLATKTADGELSISNVRIESSPIVFSKDGRIAGFRETGDGTWVNLKIYTFSLDKTSGRISISESGSFSASDWGANTWSRVYPEYPAFWGDSILYIEGCMLEETPRGGLGLKTCYYKLAVGD